MYRYLLLAVLTVSLLLSALAGKQDSSGRRDHVQAQPNQRRVVEFGNMRMIVSRGERTPQAPTMSAPSMLARKHGGNDGGGNQPNHGSNSRPQEPAAPSYHNDSPRQERHHDQPPAACPPNHGPRPEPNVRDTDRHSPRPSHENHQYGQHYRPEPIFGDDRRCHDNDRDRCPGYRRSHCHNDGVLPLLFLTTTAVVVNQNTSAQYSCYEEAFANFKARYYGVFSNSFVAEPSMRPAWIPPTVLYDGTTVYVVFCPTYHSYGFWQPNASTTWIAYNIWDDEAGIARAMPLYGYRY
ncbi:MAG: hypothetical protein NTW50_01950 [Candidatus Berkelbacteria bacterium]|nr:hypothetical protein [Candidatus Berkelbacteria bacterium]